MVSNKNSELYFPSVSILVMNLIIKHVLIK